MKAYRLIVEDLSEPWHWDDIIVYANSAGEAKSKGLKEFSGAEKRDVHKYLGYRDVVFTDIKATRHKELDKADYGGALLTKAEIREKEWIKERDEKALQLSQTNPDDLCVIWAGCYGSYWGSNRSGYSSDVKYAGKYSTKEAYEIVKGNDYTRQEEVRLLNTVEYNLCIDKELQNIKEQFQKESERLIKAKI